MTTATALSRSSLTLGNSMAIQGRLWAMGRLGQLEALGATLNP